MDDVPRWLALSGGYGFIDSIRDRLNPARGRSDEVDAARDEIRVVAGSSLPIDDAWDKIVQKVRALLPFDRVSVMYVDVEAGTLTEAYAAGLDVAGRQPDKRSSIAGTVVEEAVRGRSGILAGYESPDVLASRYPGLQPDLDAGVRSVIAVPLVFNDQVVAALTLASVHANGYSGRHLGLAQRIGALMAGPVSHTRIYNTLRGESRELAALAEIGRTMGSSSDFSEVFEELAKQVRLLLPFDQMAVALIDRKAREATNAWVSAEQPSDCEVGLTYELDDATFRDVVETGTGTVAATGSAEELAARFPGWSFLTSGGASSAVVAPLVSGDEVIGALILASTEAKGYTETDLALAKRIGTQTAGAIANAQASARLQKESAQASARLQKESAQASARLQEESAQASARLQKENAQASAQLRQEADERQTLGETGRVIASAPTIDDAVDGLADLVRKLIPFDRIEIATVDMEEAKLTRVYTSGMEVAGDETEGPRPIAGTAVEEAAGLRSPFVFQGTPGEAEQRFPELEPGLEAGLRSVLTTPLVNADRVVGAMSLSSTRPDAYGERELDLAERVGFLIAGPLVAALASGQHQPESEELATLAEIGRTVTSSVDIGELYDRVAALVRKLVPFDRIVIWTVDLQRENLIASYVQGEGSPGTEQGRAFPLTSPAAQGVLGVGSGATVVEESVDAVAGRFPDLLEDASAERPSMLLVPLVSGGETVGMLSLRSAPGRAYTDRDVALGERTGDQIAGAVANAQVYIECKQVEEAVREVLERLDLAVGGSGDGLWDWKVREGEVWWSPRLKEMMGLDKKQKDGGPRGWEGRVHPDDRERVLRAVDDHLERKVPYDVEYRLATGAGDVRWFSDRGQAIRDESGTAVRMSGSLRDITEAKDPGGHGHSGPVDLRRPLAAVEDFKQNVLEGRAARQDEDSDLLVTRLAPASRRLAELIGDLRSMSSAMDSELRREPVDLSAVARSVVRKLRKTRARRGMTVSI